MQWECPGLKVLTDFRAGMADLGGLGRKAWLRYRGHQDRLESQERTGLMGKQGLLAQMVLLARRDLKEEQVYPVCRVRQVSVGCQGYRGYLVHLLRSL